MPRSHNPLPVTRWNRNRSGGDLQPRGSMSMPGTPDCDVTGPSAAMAVQATMKPFHDRATTHDKAGEQHSLAAVDEARLAAAAQRETRGDLEHNARPPSLAARWLVVVVLALIEVFLLIWPVTDANWADSKSVAYVGGLVVLFVFMNEQLPKITGLAIREAKTAEASYARHRRLAPWARMVALAALALDGVACYFAAQALGRSQGDIMVWACLFFAVLSAGQVTLDFCQKRCEHAWRELAILLRPFVTLLGTRGKGLLPAPSPHAMAAASSASRPTTPRSSPAAIAAIVTALTAATRATAIWDTAAALAPNASAGRVMPWKQSRFAH
jgi:hypothetical protein